MKNKIILTLLVLTSYSSFSQEDITWKDLAKVTFTKKTIPPYQGKVAYPTFSEELKALNGKQVSITGYFLNIDPNEELYILSKEPMASCFFCGVGGPETAMELQFTSKKSFKTDTIIMVVGTLKLNADDLQHFNYILTDCDAFVLN